MNDFKLTVVPVGNNLCDYLEVSLPKGLEAISIAEKNHPEIIGTNYTITPSSEYLERFTKDLSRVEVENHPVLSELFKGTFGTGIYLTRDLMKSYCILKTSVFSDGPNHDFVKFETVFNWDKFLDEMFIGFNEKGTISTSILREEDEEDKKNKSNDFLYALKGYWKIFKVWWRNN